MQYDEVTSKLFSEGWAHMDLLGVTAASIERTALKIAHDLGQPTASRRHGQLIDHLMATSQSEAMKSSLSAQYGLSAFPWHTDGAHWSTPPRYLVFGCLEADEQAANTTFCEGEGFSSLNTMEAFSSIFRITNGKNSFFSSARDLEHKYYRFDPGCMLPTDPAGISIVSDMSTALPPIKIDVKWTAGRILLLDNWRMLHRRTSAINGVTRKLFRITIQSGA